MVVEGEQLTLQTSIPQIDQDMKKHGHLLNRFVAQIWDSAVDMYGIPDGVPRAITNNVSLQRNIKKYLL